MLRFTFAILLLVVASPSVNAQTAPPVLRGGVVLNEVLVDPNGSENFDSDGNGTVAASDEFVELYNGGTEMVELAGMQLWDPGAGAWFTFPEGATVAPSGYAVVLVGVQSGGELPPVPAGSAAFDAGRGSGVINNGGDNVVLYDPGADEYVQIWISDDPLDPVATFDGFSPTAVAVGSGEDFGQDRDGVSRTRAPAGAATVVDHDTVADANASPGAAPGDVLLITLGDFVAAPHTGTPPVVGLLVLSLITGGWFALQRALALAPRLQPLE